jgi:hypothetical protein
MEHAESFQLIGCFHSNEPVIDTWTFVFNEVNPLSGYYTMLATDNTRWGFSQFCEGLYSPGDDNSHLGERPRFIGEALVNHLMKRVNA